MKTTLDADVFVSIFKKISHQCDSVNMTANTLSVLFKETESLSKALFQELENDKVNVDINNFSEFEKLYENVIRWSEISDGEDSLQILDPSQIPFESQRLYFLWPEYCFPYYFDREYYRIEAIFKEFGMFIPPVPKKADMYERSHHYLELCK